MTHTKTIKTVLAIVLAAAALAACTNTIQGAGQDIENAGRTVKDSTR